MASASKFCCSSAELPAGAGVLHCVTLDRLRVRLQSCAACSQNVCPLGDFNQGC